jgi:hypothetical protein
MLSEGATLEIIVEKLNAISVLQKEHTENIQSLNRHFVGFQNAISYMQRTVQESLTYVKRLKPFINRAMTALHTAFKMTANGILNLREELSEEVGSLINETSDCKFI